jgi:hypothetical protein
MKTIVVIWVPTPDAGSAAEKAVVSLDLHFDQSPVTAGVRANEDRRDSSMSPFWTWFIENPRAADRIAI